ncbi:MAG TPA: hypothetical protein VME17_11865 [Bryobacteraceae bacterium]|nr:hypothetical protein [Bryobacteraceae bacterium]
MLGRALVFAMLSLPIFGQASSPQSSSKEFVEMEAANKDRDARVLRGLSKLAIGPVDSATNLLNDEDRKVVFDVLRRYDLPVGWTSPVAGHAGYAVEIPTIFVTARTTIIRYSNGATAPGSYPRTVVSFELYENATLVRNKSIVLALPVWRAEEVDLFDAFSDRDATETAIKRLAEKFCLAYLSANRP